MSTSNALNRFRRVALLDPYVREVNIHFLENLCSHPDTPAEERRRRGYFALCSLSVIPPLAGYAVVDLTRDRAVEASTTLGLAAILATLVLLMSRLRDVQGLFRGTVLLGIGLTLYWTATGGGDGFVFIWLYTIPLIVFFLFGGSEGAIWVVASFVILLLLFFGELGSQSHDPAMSLRFLATYGIVAVLGFGLEASRRRYYQELLAEKTALEDALADARILSGMLPICAVCKSIRDDRGYWSQIETYVGRHSEAEFSLGLCPECQEHSTPDASSHGGPDAAAGQ